MAQFHFVEDYERHVAQLIEKYPIDEAMSLAVGGSYHEIGAIEADILRYTGLKDAMSLIDPWMRKRATRIGAWRVHERRIHGCRYCSISTRLRQNQNSKQLQIFTSSSTQHSVGRQSGRLCVSF